MKYFDRVEFQCKHCGNLPEGGMDKLLLERLDELRERYGHPIYVSSAYRCPYWNRLNGGTTNSQHLLGKAADLWVQGDYHTFYNLVIDSRLFDAVGYYPEQEFVHVDVRDGGESPNYYRWNG